MREIRVLEWGDGEDESFESSVFDSAAGSTSQLECRRGGKGE